MTNIDDIMEIRQNIKKPAIKNNYFPSTRNDTRI